MDAVRDLEIDQQIFPLFDYTNSEPSRTFLRKLFAERLSSLEAIENRQKILQGMLANWPLVEGFTYQVTDFREAFQFCSELQLQAPPQAQGYMQRKWQVLRQGKEIQQKRSRLVQFALLFDQISTRYLRRIALDAFPNTFRATLHKFNSFTEKAQIAGICHSIRQDTFNKKQVFRFEHVLWELGTKDRADAWDALVEFEAYFSLAKGIHRHGFVFPSFTPGALALEGVYHPLLQNPVKNDVHLTPAENVVLLTGPNMSGKSTLLKAVGLCVYLAHLGLAVPATLCTLPYFASIAVSITSRDDLSSGYSHFMQELMTLKTVVEEARDGNACFALYDELFKGTNADDAQEILLETITGLQQFSNCYFFISTHLLNLKEHPQVQQPGIKKYHVSCTLLDGKPAFTYSLAEGWSSVKIGKILFEQVGLAGALQSSIPEVSPMP